MLRGGEGGAAGTEAARPATGSRTEMWPEWSLAGRPSPNETSAEAPSTIADAPSTTQQRRVPEQHSVLQRVELSVLPTAAIHIEIFTQIRLLRFWLS